MPIENSRIPELLKALKSQTLMEKLGLGAIFIIKQRTQKGFDVFGKEFKEYSEPYKKIRKRAHLHTSPVDLFFDHTAGMLLKIDHVVANDFESVRVLINDDAKELIGTYHNTLGAGKSKVIRKWWGIQAAAEKEKLSKIGWNELKAIINNL